MSSSNKQKHAQTLEITSDDLPVQSMCINKLIYCLVSQFHLFF